MVRSLVLPETASNVSPRLCQNLILKQKVKHQIHPKAQPDDTHEETQNLHRRVVTVSISFLLEYIKGISPYVIK